MGKDKADVLVHGRTMLDMVGDALRSAVGHVVLLGPDRPGWECWPDSVHVHGPLAGVATLLNRMDATHALVVAVDHPFVRVETLTALANSQNELPVVPVDDHGTRQVTCALYPKTIAESALEEAENRGSIQSLLDRVSFTAITPDLWQPWGEDERSWYSVDSPSALEEGLRRYQPQ